MEGDDPLVLVGASGLAREVLSALEACGRSALAILDDDLSLTGTSVNGVPIIGGVDDAVAHGNARFLVCVGSGATRRKVVARLKRAGVGSDRYASVVHPGASIGSRCSIGHGSVVLAGAVLTAEVVVGSHVVVMPHVVLTHDDVVDDFSTLCAGVAVGGGVRIGSGAYLGMNSAVRSGLRVGVDATLGMGAALIRDLPDRQTWAGVPARPLFRVDAVGAGPPANGRPRSSAPSDSAASNGEQ